MPSIYLDASNQVENVGIGSYGDEAHRMQFLADLVKAYIEKGQGNITVYRNNINMSLRETVNHANSLLPDNYLALHSNAYNGQAKGTEAFHYPGSLEGYNFIKKIYDEVAPITISSDRGIKEADFFVLRETVIVAGLIEIMFHDNLTDVNDYLSKIDRIAKSIAIGIYKHHGIEYKEPVIPQNNILYRVMCGSYSVRSNAENRVQELKNAGFEAVIMTFQK